MGCSGSIVEGSDLLINDPLNFELFQLEPEKEEQLHINELFTRASNVMEAFENLREKIVDNLDILIYKTGACIYTNPTIVHCLNNIWYKISYDLEGKIERANLKYVEDAPYMKLNTSELQSDTMKLLNMLFDYVNNLRLIKVTFKQLETNFAELIYMINESNIPSNDNICMFNKRKIEQAIKMFPQLTEFYNSTLQKFRYELYFYSLKKKEYINRINLIASEAIKENFDDIYKIPLVFKKVKKENPWLNQEETMYNNEIIGKKKYIEIINSKKRAKKDFNFYHFKTNDDWDLSESFKQNEN